MMRYIAQALFRGFFCSGFIESMQCSFPIDLLGNNSLWSVIYPISTDMFMACTVKYTKLLICISVFSEGKIKSYLSVKR